MTKKKEVLDQTAVLVNGEEKKLSDLFDKSDFVEIDANPFIKLVALQRAAKRIYGIRAYACNVIQAPEANNGWCATVIVRYNLGGAEGFEESNIVFDGAADCREGTTNPGFDKYMVALAESRAKARALRDALGVEICSKEEIAIASKNERVFTDISGNEKIEPTQAMIIRKKFCDELGKGLEDIGHVINRQIFNIDELTKEEAAKIIETFNKAKRK